MKSTELRLGNSVLVNGRETTVYHLMGDEDYFEGIEITEQWLLKLGFKEIGSGLYNLRDTRILHYRREDEFSLFGYNSRKGENPTIFKYIHQLQNLYFALTGEELCKS